MDTNEQERVRAAVRESYGKIARDNGANTETIQADCGCGCGPAPINIESAQTASCCGPSEGIAEAASCCGPSDGMADAASCGGQSTASTERMSAIMGYSKEDVESVPEGANMALGCGNPVALASMKPGETVVDLGSGGGFDCFLASKEVGETGTVIGVDMTAAMISLARKNVTKMETNNVEFRLGEIENLPVADNTADIIMSNCVINLSPDKQSVYREAYRVLKPGGRLSISDVLATAQLPEKVRNDLALVGACIGGAATTEDVTEMIEQAGFQEITITPKDNNRELLKEWDPARSENAVDYVTSAYIEAVKPS
ncbi:MAG: arsenite methyltransferase [Candidatus Adiutricales bacterium]